MGWFDKMLQRNKPKYDQEIERRKDMALQLLKAAFPDYLPYKLRYKGGLVFIYKNEEYYIQIKYLRSLLGIRIDRNGEKLAVLKGNAVLTAYGWSMDEFRVLSRLYSAKGLDPFDYDDLREDYVLTDIVSPTVVHMPFPDEWFNELMLKLIDFKMRNRRRIEDALVEERAVSHVAKGDIRLDVDGEIIQTREEFEDDTYKRSILSQYEEEELSIEHDEFEFLPITADKVS